jgi:hypothetical protein
MKGKEKENFGADSRRPEHSLWKTEKRFPRSIMDNGNVQKPDKAKLIISKSDVD